MRALFDVNFLVALFDAGHTHNPRARNWWHAHQDEGWASCPLTQNGLIRVLSQPSYTAPMTIVDAVEVMREAIAHSNHAFWPDDISFLDAVHADRIVGHRQITDVYLLALAVKNNARFVTFDRTVALAAVRDAKPENLLVLP